MGGVGFYYQTLLSSNLPEHVNLIFVQTSSQKRELSSTGKATISNIIAAINDCWRFTKAIIIGHPQITHISTAFGLSFIKHSFCIAIARLFNCRVLLHPHCSLSSVYYERSKLWQWYFRKVIRWTNGVVVLSKEWLKLGSIVPERTVYYLPNAIDLELYHDVALKHFSSDCLTKTCKVLYLGYIGKQKGSFDLLDAAIMLQSQGLELTFDLVGGSLASGELEQLREKILPLHVEDYFRLHPLTYGTEKLNFFHNADIFVYPSYSEGLPIAVLEAMACGLPIIASRVGGLPDIIQDGINGILVEPGKPDQLASALQKLANDHQLRISMGKEGYHHVSEKHDIRKHVSELVNIYNVVLTSSKN
jgi:glycosyltransferase involved in cell wall biosynthesis